MYIAQIMAAIFTLCVYVHYWIILIAPRLMPAHSQTNTYQTDETNSIYLLGKDFQGTVHNNQKHSELLIPMSN